VINLAFDEEKEEERVNILCITAQGVCKTTLSTKFILSFEDIKANCAFVASLCEKAGCESNKFCLEASKANTGKEFTVACKKSLKACETFLKEKAKKKMVKLGMKIPIVLQDPTKLKAGRSQYIG